RGVVIEEIDITAPVRVDNAAALALDDREWIGRVESDSTGIATRHDAASGDMQGRRSRRTGTIVRQYVRLDLGTRPRINSRRDLHRHGFLRLQHFDTGIGS